jgi:isocitrate/isopropylmalate dehydrogenase
LRHAIRAAVGTDRARITPDLGGSGNTESFADAVIAHLPH